MALAGGEMALAGGEMALAGGEMVAHRERHGDGAEAPVRKAVGGQRKAVERQWKVNERQREANERQWKGSGKTVEGPCKASYIRRWCCSGVGSSFRCGSSPATTPPTPPQSLSSPSATRTSCHTCEVLLKVTVQQYD